VKKEISKLHAMHLYEENNENKDIKAVSILTNRDI
jgi:hypothetical protein